MVIFASVIKPITHRNNTDSYIICKDTINSDITNK